MKTDIKPPKNHWLKWAGKKPLKNCPWAQRSFDFRKGFIACAKMFLGFLSAEERDKVTEMHLKGQRLDHACFPLANEAFRKHIEECEPKLLGGEE